MSGTEKLNIKLYVGIPPKASIVNFKRSMLYTPPKKEKDKEKDKDKEKEKGILSPEPVRILEEIPFYSKNRYIPGNISREKLLKILFNKEDFEKMMKNQPISTISAEIDEITKYNIMLIIKTLFPVGYPVINDINDSFSLLNGGSNNNTLWFNPFTNHNGYLRMNTGDIYTIQRVVWINDEFNYERMEIVEKLKPQTKTEDDSVIYKLDVPIYLMVDLIKGVVDKDNKKDIFCPFTGEILMEKLDEMMKKTTKQMDHTMLYSIADKRNIRGITGELKQVKSEEDTRLEKEIEEWANKSGENRRIRDNFNSLFANALEKISIAKTAAIAADDAAKAHDDAARKAASLPVGSSAAVTAAAEAATKLADKTAADTAKTAADTAAKNSKVFFIEMDKNGYGKSKEKVLNDIKNLKRQDIVGSFYYFLKNPDEINLNSSKNDMQAATNPSFRTYVRDGYVNLVKSFLDTIDKSELKSLIFVGGIRRKRTRRNRRRKHKKTRKYRR
jgi:hypothetical protein